MTHISCGWSFTAIKTWVGFISDWHMLATYWLGWTTHLAGCDNVQLGTRIFRGTHWVSDDNMVLATNLDWFDRQCLGTCSCFKQKYMAHYFATCPAVRPTEDCLKTCFGRRIRLYEGTSCHMTHFFAMNDVYNDALFGTSRGRADHPTAGSSKTCFGFYHKSIWRNLFGLSAFLCNLKTVIDMTLWLPTSRVGVFMIWLL